MSRVTPSGILLALAISCTILISACQRDPKGAIVGRWRDDSANETLLFTADGMVTVTGKMEITGTYSFPDATHLEFQFNGLGALANPIDMQYALSSDLLKITYSKGQVSLYKRIS